MPLKHHITLCDASSAKNTLLPPPPPHIIEFQEVIMMAMATLKLSLSFIILTILFFLSSAFGYAATVNWIGFTDSQWNTGTNWSTGALPAAADRVVIDPANYTGAMASPIISANSLFSPSRVTVQNGGVLTIQANLTTTDRVRVDGNTSVINMSAGTLNINTGKDLQVQKDGVFNMTGGTINVSNKLTVDLGGTFNMSGAGSVINVTSILEILDKQIASSSFNMSNGTVNVTSRVELDAAGTAGATPTLNVSGGIFNGNNNLWWIDNNPSVEYPHLIVSGGTVTITGNAERDASTFSKIDIDLSGGSLIFNGNLTMNTALDRLDQTGGILQFGNTKNWTNAGTYLATAGTAIFNGTTTLLDATGSWQFYNLTINAASTLNQSAPPNINVAGDWTNSGGTFIENTQKVTINGSTAQALTSTGGESFYDLTINKTAGTLTLNNNVTVSSTATGTLTMTQGNIDCLTNILTLGTSTANVGVLTHTSGTIIGKFQRWINATGAWLFPVGTATNYRSDSLVINTLTTSGSLTVEFIATDPGLLPGCPGACSLIDGPRTMKLSFSEGYWQQTVGGGLVASDYTLFLRGENFTSRFLSNLTRILKGTAGVQASWAAPGTHVDLVGVTAERANITTGLGGDFCLSETDCAVPNPGVSGASSVCKSDVVTYNVTGGLVGSTFSWTITGGLPATGTGTSINVTWGTTGGAANVRVEETTASDCFQKRIYDYPVTIHPVPTSTITGSAGVCPNTTGVTYSVTATAGYTYAWTITGGTQASGGTTNSITVDWGVGPTGQVDVIATSPTCGADAMKSLPINIGSYSSSNVTQTVVTNVTQGSFKNEIIKISIVTSNCTTGNLTQFNLSTSGNSGSTSPLTDIADAHIYYTGTSGTFATTTLFGSLGGVPNGAFTINGSQAITQNATSYFWLVYDVALTATAGNDVDGQLVSFVYDGSTITNAATPNPAGKRTISAVTQYYSRASANWNLASTWSTACGGVAGATTPGATDYVIICNGNTVILNTTTTIADLLIQSGGRLDGAGNNQDLTVNQTLNIQGTGRMTLDGQLTVNGNSILRGTGASTGNNRLTFNADLDVGSGTSLIQSNVNGNRITVVGNLIVNGTLGISGGSSIRLDGSGSISGTGTITSDNAGDKIDVRTVGRTVLSGTNLTIQPYFEIRDGVTVTNKGIISLVYNGVNKQGNLDGNTAAAVWLNDVNSTLNYGGLGTMFANTNTLGSLTASASGNTINYNYAGNQTIITPNTSTYYHLSASVSGTKTVAAALTVNGDLTSQNASVLTLGGLTDVNGNIYISNTAQLNSANNNITIAGNWDNTSTNIDPFVEGIGTVTYDGTVDQNINPSSNNDETYYSLIINNTGAGGDVNLTANTDVNVSNNLTLTDGHVNTASTYLLILASGAGVTLNAPVIQDSSFVRGPMLHTVNVATSVTKVFPIGKNNDYRRIDLTIDQTPATSTTYTAEMINTSARALVYTIPGTLTHVSDQRYYEITQSAATGLDNAQLRSYFQCTQKDDVVEDLPDLQLVQDDGAGNWVDRNGTAAGVIDPACGGFSYAGDILSSTFTSFHAGANQFSLASTSGLNPLPIELLSFDAKLNVDAVDVAWITASETNNDYFTVEKSTDALHFESVGKVKGAGNSTTVHSYSLIDQNPYSGVSYYRLKQTDFDGKFEYSNLVAVENSEEFDFNVFQNPTTNGNINFSIAGNNNEEVLIIVNDMLGRKFYSKVFILNDNGNAVIAIDKLENLVPGVYNVSATNNEKLYNRKIVIK